MSKICLLKFFSKSAKKRHPSVFQKQTWDEVQLERNFVKLIASLSMIVPQLFLKKLKLKHLKFGFKCRKVKNIDEKNFASLEFDFFFYNGVL